MQCDHIHAFLCETYLNHARVSLPYRLVIHDKPLSLSLNRDAAWSNF